MAIDMSQFYQVFFEESEEHLAAMEGLLLNLDVDNPDSEQLNAIFRAAHSIKGSAGTFGFNDLAETTHILENLLDRIRKRELVLRADMVDAFLKSGDILRQMLDAHQGRGEVDQQVVDGLCERLRQLSNDDALPISSSLVSPLSGSVVEHPQTSRIYDIQFVPTKISASGEGVARLLDELRTFGDLEVLSQPEGSACDVGFWQMHLRTTQDQSKFADLIDLVAENGAWRIVDETPDSIEGDNPAGRVSKDSPERDEEDPGYGFFEPIVSSEAVLPTNFIEEGEGFGFFAPLNPPVENAENDPLESASTPGEAIQPSKVIGENPPQKIPAKEAKASAKSGGLADSSIRVSTDKVDQLMNLVGELVITQAMLLQSVAQMRDSVPENLSNGLVQLERNTRDLQESVMSIRMLPISSVFSRFPRVVHDLSSKLGKQVELKTTGENTELDKGLIERIADPLTHLIRNSLDHGIESPERRVAAGKRPLGIITLKAYHQGGNIVIEVGDDGAGISRSKILQKAHERGFPVSEEMSDVDVYNLIFEAGFSTAEQVTDVSGRGVGMDVVRRNIQAMGGRVEIESMLGVGTRMTVRLPLTLAILDGMSIAVGDQTYILPLSAVIESFQPQLGDVKMLANQARVTRVRGEYLPVVALHELFGLTAKATEFSQGIMVVIDADGTRAALFVDALLGQHQVVIKSLEANYRRVPGVSGATIMGDGHVALILDISTLVCMAKSYVQKAS